MNAPAERADCAAIYAQLLERVYPVSQAYVAPALSREEQTELWQEARWGQCGTTRHHGKLRIIDFGTPNPQEKGPAILRAEIDCDGERLRGDVVLHARAEDWEAEGCGESAAYGNTILHVVLQAPPETWYTRTAEHRNIPVWVAPVRHLRAVCGCARLYPATTDAAQQLKQLSRERMEKLLCAAAAYRADQKAGAFEQKAAVAGTPQAWFEAWAEVLGYAANKRAMRCLARRARLDELQSGNSEAILLGSAGFLQAVLPERTSHEARAYHRRVWSTWWQLREHYVPEGTPALPWVLSPVRPMNHPARRVAALALSAQHRETILPLMNAAGAQRLTEFLSSLSHPFWDTHCTLAAAPLRRKCALVGKSRAEDFLVNVVYPLDRSEASWNSFLALRSKEVPKRFAGLAAALFGEDRALSLRLRYVQQALLQLDADFNPPARLPSNQDL